MADLAKEIWAITPPEAVLLEEQGKKGDASALRKWIFYSAWNRIRKDRTLPEARKRPAFLELLDTTINVEYFTPEKGAASV